MQSKAGYLCFTEHYGLLQEVSFLGIILKYEVIQLCAPRAEQAETALLPGFHPKQLWGYIQLLSKKSWNMLTYVYRLARKRKEKSDNNTFCTHLLSTPSHADSQNELKQ